MAIFKKHTVEHKTIDLESLKALINALPFRRTNDKQQPDISDLWMALKDGEALRLNVKNFGYQIGKQLAGTLQQRTVPAGPAKIGLTTKPTTQDDIESDWFVYWCHALNIAPIYHRKLWEFAFVLQTLHDHDMLREGIRGVGFGCGREPMPSYFAAKGVSCLMTDLEPEAVAGAGWAETGQHTDSLDACYYDDLVDRAIYDKLVAHRYVDMNNIPADLDNQFDFTWSICALEHVGSIRKGLDFVKNSLRTLKPGGIAVHTTEYNYTSEEETIDNWPVVLFLKQHFELLRDEVRAEGHDFYEPDFDVGDGVLDQFIDVPPYTFGGGWLDRGIWDKPNQNAHLKLTVDGFPATCFGIIIKKKA